MIHSLRNKSRNGRVWVAECGYVKPISRNMFGRIDDSQWAKKEIEVECSFCVQELVARHQAAIIVLQSQNFDHLKIMQKTFSVKFEELVG